jgi:hypothetical protein
MKDILHRLALVETTGRTSDRPRTAYESARPPKVPMVTVDVTTLVQAPLDATFAAMADHAALGAHMGGSSRLLTPGSEDPNGLGAVREIRSGGVRFVEEIVAFDAPHSYRYLILSCTLPIRHHKGEVTLVAEPDGTRIHWTSVFSIGVPLLGRHLEPLAARQARRGFGAILRGVQRTAEGSAD